MLCSAEVQRCEHGAQTLGSSTCAEARSLVFLATASDRPCSGLPMRHASARQARHARTSTRVHDCEPQSRFSPTSQTQEPSATGRARDDCSRLVCKTDPQTGAAPRVPEAAMCVQDVDARCVLQFTLIHAAGCALHRRTSRVIHRLELCYAHTRACVRSADATGATFRSSVRAFLTSHTI